MTSGYARIRISTSHLIVLLFIGILGQHVSASTVTQLSFNDLVGKSGLVFEGRVLSLRTEERVDATIVTIVSFQVDEVIKGGHGSQRLELSFLGGRVGNREMEVPDMRIPRQGEHGVYFVHDLAHLYVNPLVGWSQGHFLVANDPEQTIRTVTGVPVYSVESMTDRLPMMILPDSGVQSGVTLESPRSSSVVTLPAFKQRIRSIKSIDGGQ